MIVTTEHGRYEVDEVGRGQFRIRIAGRPADHPIGCCPSHWPVGAAIVVPSLRLSIGTHLQFDTWTLRQADEPIFGAPWNRITAIEP